RRPELAGTGAPSSSSGASTAGGRRGTTAVSAGDTMTGGRTGAGSTGGGATTAAGSGGGGATNQPPLSGCASGESVFRNGLGTAASTSMAGDESARRRPETGRSAGANGASARPRSLTDGKRSSGSRLIA